jgi:hypothetical protein
MKLQFFHTLLAPDRGCDLRRTHRAVVRALPYAVAASNDAEFVRTRLFCRWRRNPQTGRREMHWSTQD